MASFSDLSYESQGPLGTTGTRQLPVARGLVSIAIAMVKLRIVTKNQQTSSQLISHAHAGACRTVIIEREEERSVRSHKQLPAGNNMGHDVCLM